jgi:hypothetical protein
LATTTTILYGRPQHGETSATAGTLAKAINDLTTAAATYQVSIAKKGSGIVAVVITT